MASNTHYDVLGIRHDANADEIKAAYRRLLRRVHSDVGGTDALFQYVHQAYEVLSNEKLRQEYDRSLKGGTPYGAPDGKDSGRRTTEEPPTDSSGDGGRRSTSDQQHTAHEATARTSADPRAVDKRRRTLLAAVAIILLAGVVFYFYRLSTEVNFEIRGASGPGEQIQVHYWDESIPAGVTETATLPFDISFHPSKHQTMRVMAFGPVSGCYITDGFGTQLDSSGGEGEVDCQYIYEANKN